MRVDLSERVAVVTGGANGIGRETAIALADAGARVALWDVDALAGQRVVTEDLAAASSEFFAVDVRDADSVARAAAATVARFGGVDILVNNAGITRDARLAKVVDGAVAQMDESDFDAVVDVNLKGVFLCTRALVPQMIEAGFGRILSASSVVGLYGNFGQTNYAATKFGVIGMTKVWARELARHGITANAVAPGFIATEMAAAVPSKVLDRMVASTPVGRLGTPRDVAHAYVFLASTHAAFINGAVLSVDGGLVVGT